MLLSNLIDRLTDIYREHGDLHVDIETRTECEDVREVVTYDAEFVTIRGKYS